MAPRKKHKTEKDDQRNEAGRTQGTCNKKQTKKKQNETCRGGMCVCVCARAPVTADFSLESCRQEEEKTQRRQRTKTREYNSPKMGEYPLARNQYINNSPGIFSCIRAGANTGATCIRTELNSSQNLAILRKMIPQKYFPVFAQVRIQAAHVFERKLIPPAFFPACIGFVPGGTWRARQPIHFPTRALEFSRHEAAKPKA